MNLKTWYKYLITSVLALGIAFAFLLSVPRYSLAYNILVVVNGVLATLVLFLFVVLDGVQVRYRIAKQDITMTETKSPSRTVTVSVTEEDIKKGIRTDEFRCPVAVAVNRYLRVGAAYVDGFHILFLKTGMVRPLPRVVRDFVQDFDNSGALKVHPLSFELEVPEWILGTEGQEKNKQ